jgi:GNAT superfamily N-acetyltransferase
MEQITDLSEWRKQQIAAPAPLTNGHILSKFDCGKAPLNDWLRLRAMKQEGRSARTLVVAIGSEVIGYYSLATGGVRHDDHPLPKLKRNIPNPIPVIILARLAIDKNSQGMGLGSWLLQDAFKRSLSLHDKIGFVAVVLHAVDDDAKAFYIRYGMQEFPVGSRTLYIPIETIIKTLL